MRSTGSSILQRSDPGPADFPAVSTAPACLSSFLKDIFLSFPGSERVRFKFSGRPAEKTISSRVYRIKRALRMKNL